MKNFSDANNILVSRLKNDDPMAFEIIFRHFYSGLCVFAKQYVLSLDSAEEIVQDTFVRLWEDRKQIKAELNFKSYLFTCVRNNCLDYIKHQNIKDEYNLKVQNLYGEALLEEEYDFFIESELREKIETAINLLPEQTKIIFELSRFEDKKNKEIAEELDISIKTVEAHITKALKILRKNLKEYLSVIIFISFLFK